MVVLGSLQDSSVVGGVLVVVALSVLCALLLHQHRRITTTAAAASPHALRLPPSPAPRLPVLGHFYLLWKVSSSITALQAMSQKVGPIFTLHTSSTPIIFVTSASLLQEALLSAETAVLFAARPQLPSRALFSHNFRSINSAPCGPFWRSIRRNLANHMVAPPSVLSIQASRARSLHLLVSRLHSQALLHADGLVSFLPACRLSLLNHGFFMCFGFGISDDGTHSLFALLDSIISASLRDDLQDFFPVMGLLDRSKLQRKLLLRDKQIQLFTAYIEKHQELQKAGQLPPGTTYLQTLLGHTDPPAHMTHLPHVLSTADLVTLCTEFLMAKTYTVVASLEWTMAHLVSDPLIQSKLHKHILAVVGDKLNIEENDLPHIPYLQAVIKESLRLRPPSHFLLPHAVSEGAKLAGYDIPPHAIIQFDISCISRDPNIWEDPLQFRPERFVGVDVDMTGTKEMTMLPFGAGRRACPGRGLAVTEIELLVGGLVHALEWTSPSPGQMLDLSEIMKTIVVMKHPLKARIRVRNKEIMKG